MGYEAGTTRAWDAMNFSRYMKQDATWWQPASYDEFNRPVWGAPQHLKVRWENRTLQVLNKQGNQVTSKSKIMSVVDLSGGGQLFLGLSSATDPSQVNGAWEIINTDSIPDLRNLHTLYIAYL